MCIYIYTNIHTYIYIHLGFYSYLQGGRKLVCLAAALLADVPLFGLCLTGLRELLPWSTPRSSPSPSAHLPGFLGDLPLRS